MRKINELTVKEVEYVAFKLAKRLMTFNEPIPDFHTRFQEKLESCLATPFQQFNRKPLYTGLAGKAAMLYYLLIKNHPFQNGNKRIAITSLMAFLYKNKKWLAVDTQELYNYSMWVAQSPTETKEEVIIAMEKFINKHLVDLSNN